MEKASVSASQVNPPIQTIKPKTNERGPLSEGFRGIYPSGAIVISGDFLDTHPSAAFYVTPFLKNTCLLGTGLLMTFQKYLSLRHSEPERGKKETKTFFWKRPGGKMCANIFFRYIFPNPIPSLGTW